MLSGKLTSVFLLLFIATVCVCRPEGPPLNPEANFDYVCNALAPNPLSIHGTPNPGDGGYMLNITPPLNETANGFTYINGTVYTSKFTILL